MPVEEIPRPGLAAGRCCADEFMHIEHRCRGSGITIDEPRRSALGGPLSASALRREPGKAQQQTTLHGGVQADIGCRIGGRTCREPDAGGGWSCAEPIKVFGQPEFQQRKFGVPLIVRYGIRRVYQRTIERQTART